MDASAPPNQTDKPSPPREADDLSFLDEICPADRADELPREIDQTTLGPWLQDFFRQSPPPPARSFDLVDAVDDAWPVTLRQPSPAPEEPSDRPPRPGRSALRRKIRRLLRNRISPADAARIIAMTVLLLAGAGLIAATALRYVTHISPSGEARAPWQIPLLLASTALTWILGLTIPSLIMIKLIADLPWFRVGFYFSVIWFLAGLALFL